MSDKTQLGIYWGHDAFYLYETEQGKSDRFCRIPFDTTVESDETAEELPEKQRMVALLQQALEDGHILSRNACVALAAQDVVFRSFVIPFMTPDEVQGVVEFEITKYIPIKLEELVYSFHTEPFTQDGSKQLRVLFGAIRRDVLADRQEVLQEAGLKADHIEPASVSLHRLLQRQKQISRGQSAAVLEVSGANGKITFIDGDLVHFVRDFTIGEGVLEGEDLSPVINDIRVLFSFYSRQNPQAKIDRMLLISEKELHALADSISAEFNVPTSAVSAHALVNNDNVRDMGFLHALGSTIHDRGISIKTFEFYSTDSETGTGFSLAQFDWQNMNPKTILVGLGIGGALLFLGFYVSGQQVIGQKNKLKAMQEAQNSSSNNFSEEATDLTLRLEAYQNVRRTSEVYRYLDKIPQLLPEGSWLKNFRIEYILAPANASITTKDTLRITLNGYVYTRDTTQQFPMVNQLVSNLKEAENLPGTLTNVQRTTRKEKFAELPVTFFQIVGE